MDQEGIFVVAIGVGALALPATWFLITKAPALHKSLNRRANETRTVLAIAAGELLRDLRTQLNETLRPFDTGADPYMTRIDFELPTTLLRRYKQVTKAEASTRSASRNVQIRVRRSPWFVGVLAGLMVAAGVLAGCEDWIGLVPAQIAIGAGGVTLIAGVLYGLRLLYPYRVVHKAELVATSESQHRPALINAARAMGVEMLEPEGIDSEDDQW